MLAQFQKEVGEWSEHNFGDQKSWKPMVGIFEEIGELSEFSSDPVICFQMTKLYASAGKLAHAHLKASQNIRGEISVHRQEAIDAVGDIMIYLADYCYREGYDMETCIKDTWMQVKRRDWTRYPETGLPLEPTPIKWICNTCHRDSTPLPGHLFCSFCGNQLRKEGEEAHNS